MNRPKKFVSILLVSALALTACGLDTQDETESGQETHEAVTISYGLWGSAAREAYTKEQIAAFEEEYPYITVELNYTDWETVSKEIDMIMGNGTESDVMQINYNWLDTYSSDGAGFYDLNLLTDYIDLDAFSPLSLTQGTVCDKLNALPIAMNTTVPVYNKTMYDYYDLDIPSSIEDLYADAEIMKGDNVYQLGMGDNHLFLFLCGCYENTFDTSVLNYKGELELSDEGYVYLAQTYKDLIDNYIICPRSEYSETRIEGNRVAGVICWLNAIESYKEIIIDAGNIPEVGDFLWTDTTERLGNYYKPSTMLAISANTDHPEEAAMFLNFLLNEEAAVTLQGVEKGVPDSRYAQQYLMKEGGLNNDTFYCTLQLNYYMEYMQSMPEQLEDSDIYTAVLDTLDQYVDGSLTLDETVAALKEIK